MEESTLDSAAENAGAFDGWDEAETPAAEPSGEDWDAPEGEESPEEAQEAFLTLENGGETRRLTREEAQALARKGLEFDQVQGALQSLREQQTVSAPALDLVRQYARQNGMTEAQYLNFCRGRMQGGAPEGRQDAPRNAPLRAAMEQTRRQAAVRRDVQAFLRDYPDVRAQDIPDEVWADMHENGVSMSAAYGRYRIRSLQQEVDASRAAATSRRRSAGSLMGSLPLNNAADPAFLGWED